MDEIDRQIGYLNTRPGSDQQELINLEKGKTSYVKRLKDGASELKEIQKELKAPEGTVIAVQDRLFPGVSLSFGLEDFHLGDKGLERVLLRLENNRIAVHGMKPGEEVILPGTSLLQS